MLGRWDSGMSSQTLDMTVVDGSMVLISDGSIDSPSDAGASGTAARLI